MLSAVFLDRDGVINENREDYVKSLDELKFLPGALESIARLCAAGFRVIVVSNQQGVARGVISPQALDDIDQALHSNLASLGSFVAGIYYCPHLNEENCGCRKPKPGLLLKAARELGFDVTRAILVGDSPRDMEAARAAGCLGALVMSGKCSADEAKRLDTQPDYVATDLTETVDWILSCFKPQV